MEKIEILDENIERIGWGLLAITWGMTFLFDFLPFEMGLVGTGLILLGANFVRRLNRLPPKNTNTVLGSLLLAWGGLEFGRPWLGQLFPSIDLDWAIFAILLIGWGIILLARALVTSRDKPFGTLADNHKE